MIQRLFAHFLVIAFVSFSYHSSVEIFCEEKGNDNAFWG